jgi:hypothetical protein
VFLEQGTRVKRVAWLSKNWGHVVFKIGFTDRRNPYHFLN